jgi:hypothetical protein
VSTAAPSTYVPDYRLTRRGRLVVFCFALLVLAVGALALAGGSVATSEAQATETVVVMPGDTLWSIASHVAADQGGRDVRDTMDDLVALNDLDSKSLAAGQHLEVPAAG